MSLSDALGDLWDRADPNAAYEPIPAGKYDATATRGEPGENRNGTPYYRITFRIDSGDHAGRLVWLDRYLTEKAANRSKADLMRLGLQSRADLQHSLPQQVRCTIRVVVHAGDDGREWNEVKSFDVREFVKVAADPFAPTNGGGQP